MPVGLQMPANKELNGFDGQQRGITTDDYYMLDIPSENLGGRFSGTRWSSIGKEWAQELAGSQETCL